MMYDLIQFNCRVTARRIFVREILVQCDCETRIDLSPPEQKFIYVTIYINDYFSVYKSVYDNIDTVYVESEKIVLLNFIDCIRV